MLYEVVYESLENYKEFKEFKNVNLNPKKLEK